MRSPRHWRTKLLLLHAVRLCDAPARRAARGSAPGAPYPGMPAVRSSMCPPMCDLAARARSGGRVGGLILRTPFTL
eukprot:6965580-Prymnesium_polylepis.1